MSIASIETLYGKPNYTVLVAGAGEVYGKKIERALDYLGPEERRFIFDSNPQRIAEVHRGRGFVADVLDHPIGRNRLSIDPNEAVLAFIATPDHLGAIESFVSEGIYNLVVEKPLVNNICEIQILEEIKKENSLLRVYPLDFYLQKTIPLLAVAGAIKPDDPRWDWVMTDNGLSLQPEYSGSLYEEIGQLEAIDVNVLEGGKLGTPDYIMRHWLLEDKERGGMLRDLGTHALAPLIAAGIFHKDDVNVEMANRFVLGNDKASLKRAEPDGIETYADALIGVKNSNTTIPLTMRVGKVYLDGGNWSLVLRGSKGRAIMGLRTGDKLTIIPNDGQTFGVALKPGKDPYHLAFQEAHMYFNYHPGFDGNMQAMLDSIFLIEQIKQVADDS